MGLKATIQNAVASALGGLDDMYEDAIYIMTTSVYNPATSENVKQDLGVEVKGVKVNYARREVDGTVIQADDFKFLIPNKWLVANVVPKTTHSIKINQVQYSIVNFVLDPADAVWTFQVRK